MRKNRAEHLEGDDIDADDFYSILIVFDIKNYLVQELSCKSKMIFGKVHFLPSELRSLVFLLELQNDILTPKL